MLWNFNINLKFMFPAILRSSKLSLPFSFTDQIPVGLRIFHLFHACHKKPHPSFPALFLLMVFIEEYDTRTRIPVAARSKAWVCGRSLAGTYGCVMCCQVEVSATGYHSSRRVLQSAVCLSECDRQNSYS